MTEKNVAVVHKHLTSDGGAERVATEIARMFEAPLYVGYSDPDLTTNTDIEVVDLFDDSLALTLARRSGVVRELYSLDAWEHQPVLADYDVIIQTAPQTGWYIPTENQKIVRYVHDLPRTVYDQFQYQDQTVWSRLSSRIYRVLHATSAKFVDEWIVNSEYIQDRLSQYLAVEDASVIHPPVDLSKYHYQSSDDFYLVYSRLSPRKRVQDVVDAFRELPEQQLIVGGTGPLKSEIQSQAEELSNVEYRGYLDEYEKIELLSRAKAVIFGAKSESFGIVPVEAFASGTPVIGLESGYTRYHVNDGKNGLLFNWSNQGLINAVKRFEEQGVSYSPQSIMSESQQFDITEFRERMSEVVYN